MQVTVADHAGVFFLQPSLLINDHGGQVLGIDGLSVSPPDTRDIADYCRTRGIKFIMYNSLQSTTDSVVVFGSLRYSEDVVSITGVGFIIIRASILSFRRELGS